MGEVAVAGNAKVGFTRPTGAAVGWIFLGVTMTGVRQVVRQTIWVASAAPPKPSVGAPCNGCGVCCLLEPCPLGVLLSRRRQGACVALRWDDEAAVYRCGALTDAPAVVAQRWSAWPKPVRRGLAYLLQRGGPRWIAAGQGCDCAIETETDAVHQLPADPVPYHPLDGA